MKQLKHWGCKLPFILICEDHKEAQVAKQKGCPFIIRPKGWTDDDVLKGFLWSYVSKYYGDVRKPDQTVRVEVPAQYRNDPHSVQGLEEWLYTLDQDQIAVDEDGNGDYRASDGCGQQDWIPTEEEGQYMSKVADDYCFRDSIDCTIEALQDLKLLPEYVSEVADAIKTNVMNMNWCDGWSRKLEAHLGEYQGCDKARNLIIVDVSGSIPAKFSLVMCKLIDSIRSRCDADLIIHSDVAWFFPMEEPLPPERKLLSAVGGCNESEQFFQILKEHVLGRHWGNVIVFGDWDSPFHSWRYGKSKQAGVIPDSWSSTVIDNLINYRVSMFRWGSERDSLRSGEYYNRFLDCVGLSGIALDRIISGYALWVLLVNSKVPITVKDI